MSIARSGREWRRTLWFARSTALTPRANHRRPSSWLALPVGRRGNDALLWCKEQGQRHYHVNRTNLAVATRPLACGKLRASTTTTTTSRVSSSSPSLHFSGPSACHQQSQYAGGVSATWMTTRRYYYHAATDESIRSGFNSMSNYRGSEAAKGATSSFSTFASSSSSSTMFFDPTQQEVMDQCKRLHASIMPLNDKLAGPLSHDSDFVGTMHAPPFCLLVGNHSSGKSTFINYLAGRDIQTTGVAPTDDAFTVIAPGVRDIDRDGPALVYGTTLRHPAPSALETDEVASDKNFRLTSEDEDDHLGFLSGLRQFGPTLVQHTQLKIRANMKVPFLLVDSPGMIDAPGSQQQSIQQQSYFGGFFSSSNNDIHDVEDGGGASNNALRRMDRGYDFANVVKWLAHRADVVCLFFDPDKPGTTGETLTVLLHALSGMDHKLVIVLNKADQFLRIHDFARAYGSLCWNLSKVIPRKDLPRIYTMCLPVNDEDSAKKKSSLSQDSSFGSLAAGLQDLHTARDEVVAEVKKAPARRVDNAVTALHDAVQQLQMHATVVQDLQRRWSKQYWQFKRQQAGIAATGATLLTALQYLPAAGGSGGMIMEVSASIVATTILATGGLSWYQSTQLREWERQASRPEELSAALERTLSGFKKRAGNQPQVDESMAHMWRSSVKRAVQHAIQEEGFFGWRSTFAATGKDLSLLDDILKQDIPALRRKVSASSSSSSS